MYQKTHHLEEGFIIERRLVGSYGSIRKEDEEVREKKESSFQFEKKIAKKNRTHERGIKWLT